LFETERKKRSPESKSEQSKAETKSVKNNRNKNVSVKVDGVERKGRVIKNADGEEEAQWFLN